MYVLATITASVLAAAGVSSHQVAQTQAEKKWQQVLEAATVSYIRPEDEERARSFNQQGEHTSMSRPVHGRRGRVASAEGWFSYDLPVEAGRPLALVVTYHTGSRRPRSFEILVDGERIGAERFEISSEDRFIDSEYPIPASVTTGKKKVTVRFQPTGSDDVAAVFGIRVVRAIVR